MSNILIDGFFYPNISLNHRTPRIINGEAIDLRLRCKRDALRQAAILGVNGSENGKKEGKGECLVLFHKALIQYI